MIPGVHTFRCHLGKTPLKSALGGARVNEPAHISPVGLYGQSKAKMCCVRIRDHLRKAASSLVRGSEDCFGRILSKSTGLVMIFMDFACSQHNVASHFRKLRGLSSVERLHLHCNNPIKGA